MQFSTKRLMKMMKVWIDGGVCGAGARSYSYLSSSSSFDHP